MKRVRDTVDLVHVAGIAESGISLLQRIANVKRDRVNCEIVTSQLRDDRPCEARKQFGMLARFVRKGDRATRR